MPETDKVTIAFRDKVEGDIPFIFASWLKGLRFGNDWYGLIDSKVYFKVYHEFIEMLLAKPDVTVKVACMKDTPDVILGYAVYSGSRLDWVYVKDRWRGLGVAKDLIPNNITSVSHVTDTGRSILKKHSDIIFNPFHF
jgi:GNAT superfamily N-acetyltransferase